MDERREFTDEMRAETLTERELFAMAGIIEGASMDRLAQMYDFDDFDGAAREILDDAFKAEEAEEIGDYERVRAAASEFIDDVISEFLPGAAAPRGN